MSGALSGGGRRGSPRDAPHRDAGRGPWAESAAVVLERLDVHPYEVFRFVREQCQMIATAALIAFAFGQPVEGLSILVVIALNAGIGFATERRARRSMDALFALATVHTRVRRAGAVRTVSAESLVPGDIVLVEAGDVITADLRLLEAAGLKLDESALTGESVPVGKVAHLLLFKLNREGSIVWWTTRASPSWWSRRRTRARRSRNASPTSGIGSWV